MVQFIYNEDQIKIEEIKNEENWLLYILYNIYKEKYGNDISLIKSSSMTSSSSFYKSPLEMFKSRKNGTTSFPNNTTDIDRYLSVKIIPFEDNEDFEILEWWKKQQIKYPVLSIIARDVFVRPKKFQFLEKWQNRNFGNEIVISVKNSKFIL